jgi:hypothetical protein
MNNIFCLKRFSQLILNDLRLRKKIIFITAATLIIFSALMPFHVTSHTGAYFFILYLGGFYISSSAFEEAHDPRKAYLFLSLPCSNLERFLSKWFLTSLGYALGILAIYYAFSWLSFIMNTFVFHHYMQVLDITDAGLWLGIKKYIVLQSVILLGSILFKRHALIKVALCIGCLFLLYSLFSGLLAWMFCADCIAYPLTGQIISSVYHAFWLLLAPFCWLLTYYRLTECELK